MSLAEEHQGVGRAGERGTLERKSWASREKGVLSMGVLRETLGRERG